MALNVRRIPVQIRAEYVFPAVTEVVVVVLYFITDSVSETDSVFLQVCAYCVFTQTNT